MQGYAVLWVPGTDHAGIATQNVVERQLGLGKVTRHQLGREKFVEKVWEWKEQYGSTIVRQLRRLGSSCDWSHERFTMDEGLSKAVEAAFLNLYESDLIYRSFYMVNWCPRCQTALSDEEVVHEEVKGHLWYIRYPSKGYGEGVIVATTRPETMLGDAAVAVNPKDERYQALIGTHVRLPLCHQTIPIISDDAIDPTFGTGAVKVTPAHDPIDFEITRRHPEIIGLKSSDRFSIPPNRIIINREGRMRSVPATYVGLDRFECRERIIKDLGELLVKTEDYRHSVGHCYRCKTVIEPHLSPQWFVKMEPLAKLGIEAIENDGMRFVPDRWTKIYLDWLRNIRDWCISRQIWWGHQIPIWYCFDCNRPDLAGHGQWVNGRYVEPGMLVGHREEIEAGKPPPCPTCGKVVSLHRDPDVLDTWFSSWLWPFSTLGWPDHTKDLATFYPTSVLVTAQDIIFFWVARMVMAGKFFMKKIPFKDVYIHGIIRVEGGKKMSKSLGNIIDPLEVIERMGADGLRFSIAQMASEGQDLYLSENKFLLGRNFANKLWNAARLILEGTGEGQVHPFNPRDLSVPDRWILARLQETVRDVTESLEQYHFNEMAQTLYQFIWHDLCDWYLEIAKLQREESKASAHATEAVLHHLLEVTLRLLHPVMPFITEELWQKVQGRGTIMTAAWPEAEETWANPKAEQTFGRLQAVITEVRNIRATFRIPPKDKVDVTIRGSKGLEILSKHEAIIQRLGGVGRMTLAKDAARPAGAVASHLPAGVESDAWDIIVPLAGLVDLAVERQRIQKEIADIEGRVRSKRSRLEDPTFRRRAPSDVVEEEEGSLKELEGELAKWAESLKQLQ